MIDEDRPFDEAENMLADMEGVEAVHQARELAAAQARRKDARVARERVRRDREPKAT